VGKRDTLLAIELPRRCCPACRDEGEAAFRSATTDDFRVVLMRDRPADAVFKKVREDL
jgi:hypothetical protein